MRVFGGDLPCEAGGAGERGVRYPRETGGGLVPAGFALPSPPPPGGARSAGRRRAVLGRDSARLGRSRGSRAGLLPPGLLPERGAPFDGSCAAGRGQAWHPARPRFLREAEAVLGLACSYVSEGGSRREQSYRAIISAVRALPALQRITFSPE